MQVGPPASAPADPARRQLRLYGPAALRACAAAAELTAPAAGSYGPPMSTDNHQEIRQETREEAIARINSEHCDLGGGAGSKVGSNRHVRNQHSRPNEYECFYCIRRWPIPPPAKTK